MDCTRSLWLVSVHQLQSSCSAHRAAWVEAEPWGAVVKSAGKWGDVWVALKQGSDLSQWGMSSRHTLKNGCVQAFHVLPGTSSSGSAGSGCPSSLFATALRRPVLESHLQSSGSILPLCTVDQTQFYWWSFTGVQISGSLSTGKVGGCILWDVLIFVQIESGSLWPPQLVPVPVKLPFPQPPGVCSEGNGFREGKGLLGESVNTNDLRTAALQRRLAARGLLQWGSVLWRHKRDKELRG